MRIHPTHASPMGTKTTRLSILDNLSARFSLTHAILIYQAPFLDAPVFEDKLIRSLRRTLDDYPHLSGQLSWSPIEHGKGGRSQITYGGGEEGGEPGVGFEVVRIQVSTSKFLPPPLSAAEEKEGVRVVKESVNELEPVGKVALWDLRQIHDEDGLGLPGVRIQLSLFQDGYAIAVKMAHVLGDASTLTAFVLRWANYHTGVEPGPAALFDPNLVDKCMKRLEGDTRTDEERLSDATKLPCHRYDWHAMDDPAYPSFLKSTTQNSVALAQEGDEKREDLSAAPWDSWNILHPAGHVQLHFSTTQLQALKADALRLTSQSDPGIKISTLDALLSYIWTLINLARYSSITTITNQDVYLNCSLNARHRLSSPLPENFAGSAMFVSHVATPISTFFQIPAKHSTSRPSIGHHSSPLPLQLRHTLNKFTSSAISDLLLSLDSEAVPQRTWQAFCGRRHTLVTSWLRLGIRAIDFGHGLPADVRAIVPEMDGICQVMEANESGEGWNVDLYLECWERVLAGIKKERGWRQS